MIPSSIKASPLRLTFKSAETTLQQAYAIAQATAAKVKKLDSVNDVLIPQDLDYPGLELNINREHAGLLGISPKDVVDNVITALTSDGMIAPSFWVDPKTGNSYMLTVQYPESQIQTLTDFKQIPLRSAHNANTTPLESVADIKQINTPTEVDHYQLRREFDIYVMPKKEDLSRVSRAGRTRSLGKSKSPMESRSKFAELSATWISLFPALASDSSWRWFWFT